MKKFLEEQDCAFLWTVQWYCMSEVKTHILYVKAGCQNRCSKYQGCCIKKKVNVMYTECTIEIE